MPLNPYHLTPAASLNRLRIVDLPGLEVPASIKGRTGYELVSAHALCEQIRVHGKALKLSDADLAGDERSLPPLFDQCLESGDAEVREAAREIAVQFGRNLGYLLLTLKRGDAINREARADWDDSYWEYWGRIQTVRFGGGLLSGNMGQMVMNEILPRFAADTAHHGLFPAVSLTNYKGFLPMVGAARILPADAQHGIVMDFGGSFIKRASSTYEEGTLVELHQLESVPAQWTGEANSQALFEFMVRVIAETWQAAKNAGYSPALLIPISIASYIANGHPPERQGGAYAELRLLHPSVNNWESL